ncbi:MAG TPA: phosphatase PAP2 family protein [Bacteroidia bacterium]|nr:phosphatase PAP2 family protein [Bacteroidia bacterium]
MLETLLKFDRALFLAINHWRNPFLDAVMPVVTNRWVWIPLYVLLALLLWRRFRKQTILIAGTIVLLIVASDQTANLFKNHLCCRLRPCYNPELMNQVIAPAGCGGQYGFVSGHAANSAALALFLWLLAGALPGFAVRGKRRWWLILFLWVFVVCWSRIYMGVHYPFDVIGGALTGFLWAIILYWIYKKFAPRI